MEPISPEPVPDDTTLDPSGAAALLDRTGRSARRQLNARPPLLSLVSAVVVLVVYGVLWSSVRGQHPYRGPSLDVVGIIYLVVAIGALVGIGTYVRATSGVSGRSQRTDRILAIPMGAAIVGFYVFLGALKYDGFSNAVVYGVVDAAGPWLVVGGVLAGMAAAQEDWWKLGGGIVMVAVAAGAAFAGPINVWGVLALAGCVLLLAQAAVRFAGARGQ